VLAPLLALAAAAAQTGLPPDTTEASAAFAQCALAEARARISSPEPAEAVAEAAIAACTEQERRLWDIFANRLGPLSDADKGTLRAPLRGQLARVVNEHRGLVPRRQNEATAAGDCIRARAPAAAVRAGPAEDLVELVLQQCRAETDALRASLVRDRGEESAGRIMPGALLAMRTLAREQIAQARAAQ
jgi:hypothetical protein